MSKQFPLSCYFCTKLFKFLIIIYSLYRQDNVPDVLLSTTDIFEEVPVTGTGSLIQARYVLKLFKKLIILKQ